MADAHPLSCAGSTGCRHGWPACTARVVSQLPLTDHCRYGPHLTLIDIDLIESEQGLKLKLSDLLVVCHRSFGEIESVAFIEGVLRRTLHNGFPVVDATAHDPSHDDSAPLLGNRCCSAGFLNG